MSIASEIARLKKARTAIINAIRGKGVTISDDALLGECPWYIENLPETGDARCDVAYADIKSNSKTLVFTGLKGEPTYFSVTPWYAVSTAVSGSLFNRKYESHILSVLHTTYGDTICHYTPSTASTENTESRSTVTWEFHNGTLTLTSNNPLFQGNAYYQLIYRY